MSNKSSVYRPSFFIFIVEVERGFKAFIFLPQIPERGREREREREGSFENVVEKGPKSNSNSIQNLRMIDLYNP